MKFWITIWIIPILQRKSRVDLMNDEKKNSKLGLISLILLIITFSLIGNADALMGKYYLYLTIVSVLLFLSFGLTIAGLVRRNQNKLNNVFSVITIGMTIAIFVLGMM